tara:strand:- start:162709 stop:163761 length:1053 start_codon:yes stop_codon:yes gene_type:complete
MKILHVLTSARAEGTPKLVLDWLNLEEHEQEVLFLSDSGELLPDFKANTRVYTNSSFVPSLKSGFKISALVKEVCTEVEPDLVIAWPTGHSQWIHLGASRAGVKKKITHIGNPPGSSFFGRYITTALTFWMSYFLNVKFIACSGYVKNEMKAIGILPQNLSVVYNSLALNEFTFHTSKQKKACMIGYMEVARDHLTLLKAWKILNVNRNYQLNLIGEGKLRQKLEQFVKDNAINGVRFLGRKQKVVSVLAESDVYVLSTLREGFGITLLEAIASGCKIVCTDLPATREVLQNGRWGALVTRESADLLSEAILTAFESPNFTESEISARKTYLNQFRVSEMCSKYIEIANA